MTLHVRIHVPSKYVPSAWISLRLYVPSMFPSRVYHLCVESPPVWCPLRVVSLPKYVSLLGCSFMYILPPYICLSVCTPLLLHVPSGVYFLPCVCPSMCPLWVFVLPCVCSYLRFCWEMYSSNSKLVRQVSEVNKLTSVPTSVLTPDETVHEGWLRGGKALDDVCVCLLTG